MILRPSQKLALKIKAGLLAELPLTSDPLADWSSHLMVFDRKQYLIICNSYSFYSALLPGSGISDAKTFIHRAMDSVMRVMSQEGMGHSYMARTAPAVKSVRFAKPLSRTVTGTMNDLIKMAKVHLENGGSLEQAEAFVNGTPCSALSKLEGGRVYDPRGAMRLLTDSTSN